MPTRATFSQRHRSTSPPSVVAPNAPHFSRTVSAAWYQRCRLLAARRPLRSPPASLAYRPLQHGRWCLQHHPHRPAPKGGWLFPLAQPALNSRRTRHPRRRHRGEISKNSVSELKLFTLRLDSLRNSERSVFLLGTLAKGLVLEQRS